jgi:hypothetical protein
LETSICIKLLIQQNKIKQPFFESAQKNVEYDAWFLRSRQLTAKAAVLVKGIPPNFLGEYYTHENLYVDHCQLVKHLARQESRGLKIL